MDFDGSPQNMLVRVECTFPVGVEMEAYVYQTAAASDQCATSLGWSQAGNLTIASIIIGKVRQRSLDF